MKYWLLSLHEQDNSIRFFMGQHFTTTCKWACLHKRHCKFLISGLYRHPSPSVPIKELQMKETSSKGLGHMNLLKKAEADSRACMAQVFCLHFSFPPLFYEWMFMLFCLGMDNYSIFCNYYGITRKHLANQPDWRLIPGMISLCGSKLCQPSSSFSLNKESFYKGFQTPMYIVSPERNG